MSCDVTETLFLLPQTFRRQREKRGTRLDRLINETEREEKVEAKTLDICTDN